MQCPPICPRVHEQFRSCNRAQRPPPSTEEVKPPVFFSPLNVGGGWRSTFLRSAHNFHAPWDKGKGKRKKRSDFSSSPSPFSFQQNTIIQPSPASLWRRHGCSSMEDRTRHRSTSSFGLSRFYARHLVLDCGTLLLATWCPGDASRNLTQTMTTTTTVPTVGFPLEHLCAPADFHVPKEPASSFQLPAR